MAHELAAGDERVGELVGEAVDLPPIVHRVDHELALKGSRGNHPVLAEREGEDDDVGPLGGIGRGRGSRSAAEDIDRHRDARRVTGTRDEDRVPGGRGEPHQHRTQSAGTEDPDHGSGFGHSAPWPRVCAGTLDVVDYFGEAR